MTSLRSYQRIVLALLFAATAVNYLDRQALSVIAPVLTKQMSLSAIAYSRVIFLFLFGYTISQALAGGLIDKTGTRLGMWLCVGAWSVVSVLHSLSAGAVSFGILRFLLGMAEAGNWPGAVKAVSETFSTSRRAFAVGVFNSGSIAGAILAPPIISAVTLARGWRIMFVVVGLVGFVWVFLWGAFYQHGVHQPPETGPGADSGKRSFRAHFRNRALWGMMLGRFLADPVCGSIRFGCQVTCREAAALLLDRLVAQPGSRSSLPASEAGAADTYRTSWYGAGRRKSRPEKL